MIQPASPADPPTWFQARNALIRTVRAQLKGKHLDIRELDNEMAISSPGHPEKGRVYITYTTAEVSHRKTTWDYLGHFEGHSNTHDPDEPDVDAGTIIRTLTGPDSPGPDDAAP